MNPNQQFGKPKKCSCGISRNVQWVSISRENKESEV